TVSRQRAVLQSVQETALSGTRRARFASVSNVEKLHVYQKAIAAAAEVSAIIARPRFSKDIRLRTQLGAASESVASLIAEGSQQSTDRFFAEYLYRARGATREIRAQLEIARDRRYMEESERIQLSEHYDEIARMLTGLIAHLKREDWTERG